MPSQKVLEAKKAVVDELTQLLQNSVAGVVVDYKGINVADDTKLRKELREAGVHYRVVKNTLLRFAVNNANLSELSSLLEGTTAIAFSESDHIAAARILNKYAEASKGAFSIKGGFLDGAVIDNEVVKSLANIPDTDVLRAQFLGTLLSPITSLAVVVKAIAEKKENEEPAA